MHTVHVYMSMCILHTPTCARMAWICVRIRVDKDKVLRRTAVRLVPPEDKHPTYTCTSMLRECNVQSQTPESTETLVREMLVKLLHLLVAILIKSGWSDQSFLYSCLKS